MLFWSTSGLAPQYVLLDELVTRTYSLDQVNQGYEDMRTHRNIRGMIRYP